LAQGRVRLSVEYLSGSIDRIAKRAGEESSSILPNFVVAFEVSHGREKFEFIMAESFARPATMPSPQTVTHWLMTCVNPPIVSV
jgi:hypothetical protein